MACRNPWFYDGWDDWALPHEDEGDEDEEA